MAPLQADVTLVGGGIMSATLAMLLYRLDPTLHICLIEQLSHVAQESSAALNNAGTGHAGNCELNYTPRDSQGKIQINRALDINASFELSLQFWSHLVESDRQGIDPHRFINRCPHLSVVWGEQDCRYLKDRFTALSAHHQFAEMEWCEDTHMLADWFPLMMTGRKPDTKMAATRIQHGTDVNYGELTQLLIEQLQKNPNFELMTDTRVMDLRRRENQGQKPSWQLTLRQSQHPGTVRLESPFVFLGSGGGALPLLQKAGIPEAQGYAGFPVSGQWLICQNPEIIRQHHAKVYSLAAVGAPPMSVPHLDTRIIQGQQTLMFGPYAGFTTKFLINGSSLDLMKSIQMDNIKSLLGVGRNNFDLTKYLVKEALQSHEHRMASLRTFMPTARKKDWKLAHAGKRVQIIKRDQSHWGKLEFGTEIVAAEDGSLAALLGASPGASVSVKAMINVLNRCFPQQMQSEDWQNKLKAMIPSFGQSLTEHPDLLNQVRASSREMLDLND